MVNRTLARRYAIAVARLAHEQSAIEQVTADLTTLASAIGAPGLVRDFFESPVVDRPSKERLLAQILNGKIHPIALHTLLLLVRKRREGLLSAIVGEYLALERAARGAESLTLESARRLDRDQFARLISKLEQLYGKKFEVTEVVNPLLIGGLRIMVGDRRVDDSIAGRFAALARELFAAT
jgi:F-type H+-transporting ATPase subunit delta